MTEELKDSSSNGLNLHALLRAMMDYEASDLHITTGSPPQRIDGSLTPLKTDALRPVILNGCVIRFFRKSSD